MVCSPKLLFIPFPRNARVLFSRQLTQIFSFFSPSNLSQSSAFLYSLLLGRKKENGKSWRTFFLPISLSSNLSLLLHTGGGGRIFTEPFAAVCVSFCPLLLLPSHACEPSPLRTLGGAFLIPPAASSSPLLSALPPLFLRAAAYFRSFPPRSESRQLSSESCPNISHFALVFGDFASCFRWGPTFSSLSNLLPSYLCLLFSGGPSTYLPTAWIVPPPLLSRLSSARRQ